MTCAGYSENLKNRHPQVSQHSPLLERPDSARSTGCTLQPWPSSWSPALLSPARGQIPQAQHMHSDLPGCAWGVSRAQSRVVMQRSSLLPKVNPAENSHGQKKRRKGAVTLGSLWMKGAPQPVGEMARRAASLLLRQWGSSAAGPAHLESVTGDSPAAG